MEEKVKNWILTEYRNLLHGYGSKEKVIDRCYGVLMFAMNECFNSFNTNLCYWWEDEMLPKFRAVDERMIYKNGF